MCLPVCPLVCPLVCLLSCLSVLPAAGGHTRWSGEGTSEHLQEVLTGRCYEYVGFVNPSVGEKNCTLIVEAFLKVFTYRHPCDVQPNQYQEVLSLAQHPVPVNKSLFWEKNKPLVKSYSEGARRMMPLENTLIGWMTDELYWCGSVSGEGLDHTSCPTNTECEDNPLESFWRIASTQYASLSSGDVHVMLNGSVMDAAFPQNSFFAQFELPYIRKDRVSHVYIWVIDNIDGPDIESCHRESVAELETILQQEGFRHTCIDNHRPVRLLQCVDIPNTEVCVSLTGASDHLRKTSLLFLTTLLLTHTHHTI